MNPTIERLTAAIEQEAGKRRSAADDASGVGPITALAFVLIIGTPGSSSSAASRSAAMSD